MDLLYLKTGFIKQNKGRFDANLLVIQPIVLFSEQSFFCKIPISLFKRVVNNYYVSDEYCRNSKALSISASKIVIGNNFRKH
jgi:hypothetical protein